ncbi:MAG: NAD(+) diphosphatase [Lentisphaeria bacterium]|nr:NAD(+) diphosphatase [Lentisphaeria bacterium]
MNQFIPSLKTEPLAEKTLPGETFVFAFHGRDMLMNGTELPRLSDFPNKNDIQIRALYVGNLNGIPCIGIPFPEQTEWNVQPLRAVIHSVDEAVICAICRAKELMFWRERRKFCGKCGHEMEDSGTDLARVCPNCRERYYPQIAPAVITAVLKEDKILLAHNRNFTSGVHSLIAGFVESGESLEQAVAREILEETSIKVKNIRYYSSQPWPFPNSLMLGFVAEYESGELTPDGTELETAGWFSADELPMLPDHGSIARKIIDDFIANRQRMI